MNRRRSNNKRRRWQFGLRWLFGFTALVSLMTAMLTQGYFWEILAGVIIANAVLFAVIVGLYDVDDDRK